TDSRLMWTFSDPTRLLDPDRGNTGRGSTGRGSTGRTRTVERLWHSGSVQTLEVRDLSRRYGDLTVLNSVSFTLHAGQVAAVVGPNGAGDHAATVRRRCRPYGPAGCWCWTNPSSDSTWAGGNGSASGCCGSARVAPRC